MDIEKIKIILLSVLAVGGMGVIFGALLSIASKIFAVEKDERVDKITECLPGANCGGCGYAGCGAAADAIVKGEAKVSCCPVGGQEAAAKIAEIMGVKAEKMERMTAFVMCAGNHDNTRNRFKNNENIDCHTANRLAGGIKECAYGCLGFGSCVKKCVFGALSLQNGIAVVDRDKCTNCGTCMAECPRQIIKRIPYSAKAAVECQSLAKGKDTKAACDAGCLGCTLCVKVCEFDAISVVDNCAVIDYEKCTGCGKCQEKCPRKIIRVI